MCLYLITYWRLIALVKKKKEKKNYRETQFSFWKLQNSYDRSHQFCFPPAHINVRYMMQYYIFHVIYIKHLVKVLFTTCMLGKYYHRIQKLSYNTLMHVCSYQYEITTSMWIFNAYFQECILQLQQSGYTQLLYKC